VFYFHGYINLTPGMKILGLKFIDTETNKKPTARKMIFRWFMASLLRIALIPAIVGLAKFEPKDGFYWDRWLKIKQNLVV